MCQFLECFLEPSVWGKYSFLGSSTKNFQAYAKLFWKQPPPPLVSCFLGLHVRGMGWTGRSLQVNSPNLGTQ